MSSKKQLGKFAWCFLWLAVFRQLWHTSSDASAFQHEILRPPTLISSVGDANFVFEILLKGLAIDEDNNVVMLDQELASMKLGRTFLTFINDHIPKTVPAMEQLLLAVEDEDQSLSQDRFETLILGIIFSAYQTHRQRQEAERQAWRDILGRLANITHFQLRKS